VALAGLVKEIGRRSGVEVPGACEPRNVSAEFDAEPVSAALERLLGQRNSFALRYGPDGGLRAIELLPQPSAASVFSVGIARADEAFPTTVRQPGFPGLTPSFGPLSAAAVVGRAHAGRGATHAGRRQRPSGPGRGDPA